MIRINLLPVREARRRADLQQQILLFVGLLALVLLGMGYAHYSIRADIAETTQRVAQTEAQIKQFEPQLKQVEAYKKKKQAVQEKLDVIRGLERSRSGPVHIMDELATRIPDRMWITKLEAKGRRIAIEGLSLDNEIVAVFLTELGNSPYFGNVELEKTELTGIHGLKMNVFAVSATIEDPEKPEAEGAGGGTPGTTAAGGGAAAGR